MATLNGRDIVTTWRDLVRFENANAGLPADGNTLMTIEDGDGNTTPVQISRTKFNVVSGFMLAGVALTATATQLNSLVAHLSAINGNNVSVQISRSDTAGIPGSLLEAQLHINTDTGEMSYGDTDESVVPLKLNGSNLLGTVPDARLSVNVPLRNGVLQTNLNAEKWGGRKVHVGTGVPGNGTGDDGDIYFVYTP